jgi:tetratricopeptide (TPR) repeat protein
MEHLEFLLNEGEPERAWNLCRRGLRRYPRDPDLWLFLGDSLVDSRRLGDADKAYRKAAELRSDWGVPVAKQAEVRLMEGNLTAAFSLSEQAHDLERNLAHASHLRGVCCELAGREEEAAFWFHRAHRLQPEHFFVPARITAQRFMAELVDVLDGLRQQGIIGEGLDPANWVVLDEVDPGNPDLEGVSLLSFCHIVRKPAGRRRAGARSKREAGTIERGYLFRRNNVRECRTPEDLNVQLYVAISDEVESIPGGRTVVA